MVRKGNIRVMITLDKEEQEIIKEIRKEKKITYTKLIRQLLKEYKER